MLIICKQDHVEGYMELSAKTKTYFSTAVALWDAEFYVKVDDDVHVNLGKYKYLFFLCSFACVICRCRNFLCQHEFFLFSTIYSLKFQINDI